MISLRPVTIEDEQLLLEWRRDPSVIENSLSGSPPDETTHSLWLRGKLDDKDEKLFIAIDPDSKPVGFVRLSFAMRLSTATRECELHFLVAPECRDKGIGGEIVLEALNETILGDAKAVSARVRYSNSKSRQIFKNQGFKEELLKAESIDYLKKL